MAKINKSISVFFPAYNDEATVERMVSDAVCILDELTDDYEVVIVDDGSNDNTGDIIDELAGRNKKIKVIHHDKNKGYGGALKSGFNNSTKELIFYTDTDGQYDIREMIKLLPWIDEYDFIYGNRIRRSDHLLRVVIGYIYGVLVRIMFNLRYKDITCDFRLFKKSILSNFDLKSNSAAICVELLKKIQNNRFKVKTVIVNHYFRKFGRSQAIKPRQILILLKELVQLWYELYG